MSKRTTSEEMDQATSLPEDASGRSMRLTTYFWALIAIWTIVIICLLALDFFQIKQVQREMAITEARANFDKDQAFRFWAAKHGGVFVPINSRTPQNPFLSHVPERDITTESGKALTLMNPAYMLRQMLEEYEDLFGIRGHITSLKHYRPETAPDEWEKAALVGFERGDKEVLEFTEIEGTPYLRLMRPMMAKKSCLKCHAKQGYKVGDVRGGVSISVPMSLYLANQRKVFTIHAFGLVLVWLLGIAGIGMATRGLRNHIRERERAEAELQKAHDRLEVRVEERTVELKKEIVERKQAGEAVREREKRARQYLDIAGTAFVALDNEGNITLINKRGLEILGYQGEELLGKNWFKTCLPERMTDDVLDVYHQLIRGDVEPVEYYKNPVLTKDGKERIMAWHNSVLRNPDDEIVGILSSGEDITEYKRAEEALRESEEKYRSMMEAMIEPIYICSPDFQVEYMNPAMIRRVGRDVTGEHCFKALHDLEEKCPWCLHDKVQEGESLELEIVSPKDNRSYHISQSPIAHGDGSVSKLTVFRDTTDFKTMETQLQQSQKMEAVGTLAGGIAHDFNNILAIILGNAELASDDVPDWNPASSALKEISMASLRAKDMVQQLLSFSRKADQESKPINMVPIIRESLKMLRSAVPTSVAFAERISDDPCNISGNSTQINQIMMNLVTNAAQAMSEKGGTLEVTLENTFLQEEKACFDWVLPPGAYMSLKVRDTGEGIDPDVIDRIFDPYYTTKEVGKGTGMGLSVTHGIVKSHGGGIGVESKRGEGTVFEIYFPALEKTTEIEKKPVREIKGGSERVLFVDDEESLVNLNHQRLERLGYRVKSTTDPEEALKWFRADPDRFDIIITDMTMPKMTGDRLAREILATRPHMPVIICTGYSDRISEENAKALGIREYIEKPIETVKLAWAIREILDEH